jgi:hypothetical protein
MTPSRVRARLSRPVAIAAIGAALLTLGAGPSKPPPARVLFIGNSLTVANNLPAMIEAVAAQAGLKGRILCRGVAFPNFGLQDHWERGDAVRGIQSGSWTHVVLQQGPTSQPDSRANLIEYTRKFAFEARARGAKIALYMVWPPRDRLAFFDGVSESYTQAAEAVHGILVPVGEGWRAAWRRDPTLALYGPDDFHPSPLGTYLAALIFFAEISGRSPVGLPAPDTSPDRTLRDIHLTAAELATIQAAAAEAGRK